MVIVEVRKEMIWMTNYLEELDKKQCDKILYINNQGVTVGEGPDISSRSLIVSMSYVGMNRLSQTRNIRINLLHHQSEGTYNLTTFFNI